MTIRRHRPSSVRSVLHRVARLKLKQEQNALELATANGYEKLNRSDNQNEQQFWEPGTLDNLVPRPDTLTKTSNLKH